MNSAQGTMTGIIFTGGKGPPPELIRILINEAQGERVIAAADSGLDAAEKAGLRPDWIIGDMDSISGLAKLDAYPKQRVMRYPIDKDWTDTELAFSCLRENGCDKIWIVGGGGGRIDHLFGIRSLCEREAFPERWITDTADIHCAQADEGQDAALILHQRKSALVSVLPLADGPWKILSRGLKWPLDEVKWDKGFTGLSNEALDGEVSLTIKQGRFMVIVPGFNETEKSEQK